MTAPSKQLPANPNITQLKKQAKDLQRAASQASPDAVDRIKTFHPSISDAADFDADSFTLRDAQVTIAREYGFDGWLQLNTEVGERMVEERDLHRWFGVQLNNGMWDKIEDPGVGPSTPRKDRELLLYSAYAAAYHWRNVGGHPEAARGEHLISRMAVKVGEVDVAVSHARRCLELIDSHSGDMEDWDAPFGHEALSRALAASGDMDGARRHRELAETLTAAVADEMDRQILEGELAREPWFGVV